MSKKAIVIGTCVALLGGVVTIATAADVVGPLGSIKLDKPKSGQLQAQPAVAVPATQPAAIPATVVAPVAPKPQQAVAVTPKPAAAAPAPAQLPVIVPAKPQSKVAAPVTTKPTAPAAMPEPPKAALLTKAAPAPAPAKPIAPAAAPAPAPTMPTPAPVEPVIAQAPIQAELPGSKPRRVQQLQLSEREVGFKNREADLVREIRILELEAKKRDLQRKISGEGDGVADSVNLPPPPPVASVLDVPEEPPVRLISVWGDPSKLTADVLANGVRTSVKAGDPLPDGWRVMEVGRNSVLIRRGGKQTLVKIGG